MKICLVNKSYLNPCWDGISAYTHHLAQGLSEYGHEVHIITYSRANNCRQDENRNKIWIHKVKLFRRFGKFNDFIYGLKVYFKFKEIDKKYGIDIVEAPEAGAEGFWLAIFAKNKLVTRLHTPMYLCHILNKVNLNWSRRLLGFMERIQIQNSALVSSPTQSLARIVSKMWGIKENKIEIIPNPICLNQYKKNQKIKSNTYLLYIGRMERLKGVNILFKALEIILEKYPKLKIIFVGGIDGTYDKNQLKKISPKIKKNLVFLGERDHAQVFSYIKGAKLIILPSLWENLPYTLLESLALGKVIIASNCGGFKEVIKNGQNGFLFKLGSHKDLAQKIIKCLNLERNKIKAIANNAKNTALKYNSQKIVPQMINFYQRF